MSWYQESTVPMEGNDARYSAIIAYSIRLICPLLVLICIFLIINGHISPGGGFQGGVIAAAFFICRYMIHDIQDVRIDRAFVFKKYVFIGIALLFGFSAFLSAGVYLPIPQTLYLLVMNLLIGFKVACGFLVVFYRFIAIERR